jgi:hypothetical protein
MTASYRNEAAILGAYLLGQRPSEHAIALYEQAMQKLDIAVTGSDERLLRLMLNNPVAIGIIDAGLALARPRSAIRRKLLVYLAILESLPEYAHLFLPQSTGASYHFYILWVGIRSAFKAAVGVIIVKLV